MEIQNPNSNLKNPPGRSPIGAGGLLFADQIWWLRLVASRCEATYPTATTSTCFAFVNDDEVTSTITPDAEQGAIFIGAFLSHFDCFFGGLDRFAIDFLDDVARFESGFGSRRVGIDISDDNTANIVR